MKESIIIGIFIFLLLVSTALGTTDISDEWVNNTNFNASGKYYGTCEIAETWNGETSQADLNVNHSNSTSFWYGLLEPLAAWISTFNSTYDNYVTANESNHSVYSDYATSWDGETSQSDLNVNDTTYWNSYAITSFTNLTDFVNYIGSPMLVTGGALSEGTNAGTLKVGAMTVLLRTTSSATGDLEYFSIAETDNITITLEDTKYHVGVSYNGGSPVVSIQTGNFNRLDEIGIGNCMKENSNVHFTSVGMRLQDGVSELQRRAATLRAIELTKGCTITEDGTRNISIASGVVYEGIVRLTPFSERIFNTSNESVFTYYYSNGTIGYFTKVENQTTIDNTQYDDGDGTLGTLTTNEYGVFWVYLHPDEEHVFVVYGTDSYKLAEAEDSDPPSNLPVVISDFAVLLGRIIIEKDAASFTQIDMVTTEYFGYNVVTDHGSLAGLGDDDHPQYLLDTDEENLDVNSSDYWDNWDNPDSWGGDYLTWSGTDFDVTDNWWNSYADFMGTNTTDKWCLWNGTHIVCDTEPVSDTDTNLTEANVETYINNTANDYFQIKTNESNFWDNYGTASDLNNQITLLQENITNEDWIEDSQEGDLNVNHSDTSDSATTWNGETSQADLNVNNSDYLDGEDGSYYLDDTTIGNCSADQSCANVLYTTDEYLGGLSCSNTEIAKYNSTSGKWECEADAEGSVGRESMWVDGGTYLYPNSTYADDIQCEDIQTTGDIEASANGGTTGTPRVFGFNQLSSNEAVRFQFGDKHNGFQNAYGNDVQIYSYWGLVLDGGRQNYNSDFNPPDFEKTLDSSVIIRSSNDIGDDSGSTGDPITVLKVMGAPDGTANITEWTDNDSVILSSVSFDGNITAPQFYQGSNGVCDDSNNCAYISDSAEGDLNVNSSDYWDNLDTFPTLYEANISDADWWDADGDISTNEISESKIDFDTACAAGNHYYLNGDNLACEADDDTTYDTGDQNLTLIGTSFFLNSTWIDARFYNTEAELTALLDDDYVDVSGDTMTGTLKISTATPGLIINDENPEIFLNDTDNPGNFSIYFSNGANRFQLKDDGTNKFSLQASTGKLVNNWVPFGNNSYQSGTSAERWSYVYGVGGDFLSITDGTMTIVGGDLTGADDINSTEFYQNGNKVLDTSTSFGGDVSGTYGAIQVEDTQGLLWGNISGGWDLN
ncbi:MAG: hypothetical protein ACTSO3_15285, partial [Candidatus Heimdallarchaeaceae archaeon]